MIAKKGSDGAFHKANLNLVEVVKEHFINHKPMVVFTSSCGKPHNLSSAILWYGGEANLHPYMSDPRQIIFGSFRIEPANDRLIYNSAAEPLNQMHDLGINDPNVDAYLTKRNIFQIEMQYSRAGYQLLKSTQLKNYQSNHTKVITLADVTDMDEIKSRMNI